MIDYALAGQATVIALVVLAAIYWIGRKCFEKETELYENDDTHWI